MSITRKWLAWTCACLLLSFSHGWTANFASVHYDPGTDELVVTFAYRGTHPNHKFSLQWGECKELGEGSGRFQVAAEVLDSDWRDRALEEFQKTERFSLASLQCRPAELTLRTAPGFFATVTVPADHGA